MKYAYFSYLVGTVDSSGLRFYYTDKVRKYDAGTFLLGHSLWWPPLTIPPKAKSFSVDAYCAKSCTNQVCVHLVQ